MSDKTSSQQIIIPNNNKKQCHKVSLIDLGRCDVAKKTPQYIGKSDVTESMVKI